MKNSIQVLIQEKVDHIFKLLEGAREPVSADINALNATISNLRNYYAADDLDQAIEYASLAAKQAQDVASNLERAKATKGAVDQIKGASKVPTASTLHQKVEDEIQGQDTDDLTPASNTGNPNDMKGQMESKVNEKDGELKFKIKVKAKLPIDGDDIKGKADDSDEETREEKDAKKATEKDAKVSVEESKINKISLPKTGKPCSCKKGIERDNRSNCEGTGMAIDWRKFHADKNKDKEVKESLTEAKVGDKVIYNGNGAKGYQGKTAQVIGVDPTGEFAVIKFEDGAVYKGAKVSKLAPAVALVADPVKDKVQTQRVGANDANKPFNQKADDEQFELEKQMALPAKNRPEVKESSFAVGISTPQAVGTVGAPAVTNKEEIEKDAKKDDRTKENAEATQNNKGIKDGDKKNEAKIEDLLNPNDEKARQEILEMAERCFLAIRLSEKTELTEKEKKFIAETNAIKVDESKKKLVKECYRKMFSGSLVRK